MLAQQTNVETISNNLANMSTTGYNARRAEFADLHYQQLARPGTVTAQDGTVLPTGVQLGMGVRPTAVSSVIAQGTLSQSGGDLDLAIRFGAFAAGMFGWQTTEIGLFGIMLAFVAIFSGVRTRKGISSRTIFSRRSGLIWSRAT